MGVKRQQGSGDQKDLFDEALKASLRHGDAGDGGTGAGARAEPQAPTASERQRALTRHLMEEVASSANLNLAYKRVKANKGSAGVDGMTIDGLRSWIAANREGLIASLLSGNYQPKTVRGVEIPKPGGGVRLLGIPTVVDRLVQQAILQVLSRSSIRHSRRRASASARAGAPTKRSPRLDNTLPTAATSSWISTWRGSSTGSTTMC